MPIPLPSLNDISTFFTLIAIPMAAWGTALWVGLVIWTFKDMRARSRDPFAQIMASIMVGVLTVPGWLIYLMLRPRETLAEAYERALEEEALLQEIEERPTCPGCSRPVQDNWKICPHCHTRMRKNCPECRNLLELQWNLCPYCGNTGVGGSYASVSDARITTRGTPDTTEAEPDEVYYPDLDQSDTAFADAPERPLQELNE
jgi:RNA polymerase subunit RPABC4/transcription elongation factor Spt4